ncbi:hypothetical protein HPB49_015851 [Dermacentor silvarum]|uniref:Uncharacterized protein n=1 Tax=Dermacentor silvarum TaxID=543639 RepID=A0ACB8CG17_DERSI|nr:hypothetical protein HPB49_015851 [Dermacentor silvarum]
MPTEHVTSYCDGVPTNAARTTCSTQTSTPNKARNFTAPRMFRRSAASTQSLPRLRSSPRSSTHKSSSRTLSRGPPTTNPIHVHSTSDTSSAIPTYDRVPQECAQRWIAQVERIAALAHWTSSLTLACAANRLTGSARDWQSANGSRYETWE